MLNEAIELYSSMRKDDFITSTQSVNRLLRTLVDLLQARFHSLLTVIVGSSIWLNVVTYEEAIQAAVMLKDLDKGFELMKSMEKDGMGPSVFAYNLILGGLCKVHVLL